MPPYPKNFFCGVRGFFPKLLEIQRKGNQMEDIKETPDMYWKNKMEISKSKLKRTGSRIKGTNPRALGTNPRALKEKESKSE